MYRFTVTYLENKPAREINSSPVHYCDTDNETVADTAVHELMTEGYTAILWDSETYKREYFTPAE